MIPTTARASIENLYSPRELRDFDKIEVKMTII